MRWWRLLAVVVTGGASLALANACSTDSFGPDGGDATADATADAAVEADNPQQDFCNAQAAFFAHCSFTDACYKAILNNCGTLYSYFAPGVTTAFTTCATANELPCTTDFGKLFAAPCMQMQNLANDSGAYAKLTADYCQKCEAADAACPANFDSNSNSPGYLSSIFDDFIVNNIDTSCAQGASTAFCTASFEVCAAYTIGSVLPQETCDGGGD